MVISRCKSRRITDQLGLKQDKEPEDAGVKKELEL